MSDLRAHRAAIVAALAAVPDVGHVHERERYAESETAFRAMYLYTPAGGAPEVRGWWLRRVATREHVAGAWLHGFLRRTGQRIGVG